MNQNQLLIASFAIAAVIAVLGALFCVHLSIFFAKEMRTKYNRFLISQQQLSITLKQA